MFTGKLSEYFEKRVRSRGHRYYHDGHVRLGDFDPDMFLEAGVTGSHAYTVDVKIERKRRTWTVRVGCSCPYGDSFGEPCKHIWATLLAIEEHKQSDLSRLGPSPSTVFLDSFDDFEEDELGARDEDDGWDDGIDARTGSPMETTLRLVPGPSGPRAPGGRSTSARRAEPGLTLPAWQSLLRRMPSGGREHLRERPLDTSPIEPIYVLEGDVAHYRNYPAVSLAQQRLTAGGKLGKIKKLALSPRDIIRVVAESDRTICLFLLGAGTGDASYAYYDYHLETSCSTFSIPPSLQGVLLPLLAASGRFMFRLDRNDSPTPVAWDDGGDWELALSIRPTEGKQSHTLQGRLRRGGETCSLETVDCFLPGSPCLFVREGTVSPFEAHGCFRWLDPLGAQKPVPVSKADLPKLLDELAHRREIPPVEWPQDWDVTEIDGLAPQPVLSLTTDKHNSYARGTLAQADVAFRYGEIEVPAAAPSRVVVDAEGRRLIRRQPETEQRLLRRLLEAGVRKDSYYDSFSVPRNKVPRLVTTLIEEGWHVWGNRKPYRRAGEFSLSVSSGIDWFDVDAKVHFDGQSTKLPELLAALEKGERFVQLADGSLGMLPDEWLSQHRGWLEFGQREDGRVRYSKTQIGLLDALLSDMPEATCDANVTAARKKLAQFSGVEPRNEPAGFQGELRPYQREGLGWLRFLDDFDWGGCLADDMGLGKTVQVLALLAETRRQTMHGPSLIVAPKSVVFNWVREAERFAPKLRILNYTGTQRAQSRNAIGDQHLVLTTYGTLRRDIKFLQSQDFNYVVLDEAQAIKNAKSKNAQSARLLAARRRLAMTGTPVENELADLWSIFEFLNPGMLGTLKAFKGFTGAGRDSDASQLSLLQRMMRPFILRRTKGQVATDLPQRSEQTIECELPKKQAKYYDELRDHYRRSLTARVDKIGLARSKMHVLEALLRLRQAACHPGLIDESKVDVESAKLDTLLPMLTELVQEGHKALVFSQFTKMLAIVRTALDRDGITYEYLDGRTRKRSDRVDRFQNDPDCPLFLISLKAGGTGLNLTAADYVFILDPWWNPAVEAQAIDRAHRIGQTKKVIAYRLIAQGTVESKILELQQTKRELADAIITQQNSLIRSLTREDLDALLG